MVAGPASKPSVVAVPMRLGLRGTEFHYAVLYSNPPADEDPVYRHCAAHPLYDEPAALAAHLAEDAIPIDQEAAGAVDIDEARAALGPDMSRDAIEVVLNAWNALDDLTKSLGVPLGFFGRLANRSYDKLFWGLNLEAVTPPGQWYVPRWSDRELAKIDQVLRECGSRMDERLRQNELVRV